MGIKDMVGPITSALLGSKVGSLGDSLFNSSKPGKQRRKEYERQKEFAQYGLSWKVEDAIRAGLHPLAALGAQISSYAPQSIGGDSGVSFDSMGADLSTALALATGGDGSSNDAMARLQLDNMGLQNDLIKAQIASINAKTAQAAVGGGGTLAIPQADGSLVGVRTPPGTKGQVFEDEFSDLGVVFAWPRFETAMRDYLASVPGTTIKAGANTPDVTKYLEGHMY